VCNWLEETDCHCRCGHIRISDFAGWCGRQSETVCGVGAPGSVTINLEFYALNYQFKAEINLSRLSLPSTKLVYLHEIEMKVLTLLLKDERGVTAIEYSLVAALIAVAAIGSFTLIGTSISTTFSTVAGKL
jgi:pilus assembly protein Flp/PilA